MHADILRDFAIIVSVLFVIPCTLSWLWEYVIKPLAKRED